MNELHKEIEELLKDNPEQLSEIEEIRKEKAVFPFSTESRMLAYMLSLGVLSYEQYERISQEYSKRNRFLELFELAPRTFGETWGEKHLLSLFPEFEKATKENLADRYPGFDGEFDLWLDGIRVEVKACRANSDKKGGSLASRAYLHEEAIQQGFKYHYQQLKPSCCDVFIWIGVCRDELIYWVLTSEELKRTGKLGSQHRNENTGMDGVEVFEGQVFMTEEELEPYRVLEQEVLDVVKRKGYKGD